MIQDRKKTLYYKIDGLKTPVWIYGDLKNPLIFFIHGYPKAFSEYVGDLPVRYLKNDYCIVAFDLPGCGVNQHLRMDAIKFIRWIAKEITKERKYFLFGSSWGGVIALAYALKYRDKVIGIIISGLPYHPIIGKISFLTYWIGKVVKTKLKLVFDYIFTLSRTNLSKIKTPVLLLYSTKDNLARVEMGKSLAEILPKTRLVVTGDRSHGWLLHRIDKNNFYFEIVSFLKESKLQ